MGTRESSVAHPCPATKVVTIVFSVIPCNGSRGWVIARDWCVDESGMRESSVPIAGEFHKWL